MPRLIVVDCVFPSSPLIGCQCQPSTSDWSDKAFVLRASCGLESAAVVAGLALTVKMSQGGPGQLTAETGRGGGGVTNRRLSPQPVIMVKMSAAHS